MQRLLVWGVALVLLPLSAMAQDTPKAEIFGGYSYLRADTPIDINLNPIRINLNGWNASVTGNVNRWLGVVGDFSGHYGTPSFFGFNLPIGLETNLHTFLFGPRVYARTQSGLTPFGHALFGFGRGNAGIFGASLSETKFAMALGGGVDLKLSDAVALRLIQADYVQTRFQTPLIFDRQHNARLSAGIVFRIGTE